MSRKYLIIVNRKLATYNKVNQGEYSQWHDAWVIKAERPKVIAERPFIVMIYKYARIT